MKWTPKRILGGIGVLLAVGVAADLGRSMIRNSQTVSEPVPVQQVYAGDSDRYAVTLSGERREQWLKKRPLREGDPGPALTLEGDGGKRFRIPAPDGKQSVELLTSATRHSTPLVAPIRDFVQLYGDRAQIAIVVLNTDQAAWDQHRNNLGKSGIVLYQDKTGEVLEKLRPDVPAPEVLPAVWGFDPAGKVRFFAQPTGVGGAWRDDLRAALEIPKAQEDLAVGTRRGDAPGPAHP